VEEKNQQDRFLGVDREWGDDPEGRVKVEGASQEYEFSSEESEGEENNREAQHDPPDSRSPEGRVKGEGESRGYEFSSEESEGEEDNRKVKDDSLNSSSPEGRVKGENENREYESSCEESVGEKNKMDKLLHSYFFETMYIGDKGMAQVSRVAPLEFKASLFPKNVTRFSPVGDPNFGHSLLKCPMAPQWKHPCLSPFLGDGLIDCARYLSIRFLFTSSIIQGVRNRD
jgi:hypothetical protein